MKTQNIRNMILVSLFAAFMVIGAFISIPFTPVPISLQTLFTLLAGMVLGSKLGAVSQLLYLFLGVIGLPVFSGFRGGPGILLGPTGGFLIGFVIAAYVIGKFIEAKKESRFLHYVSAGLLGTLIIYLIGAIQLSLVAQIGVRESMVLGVIPFLIGDLFKIIIATFIAIRLKLVVTIH
jgi:biotin transport system substrate-specific component